VDWDSVLVSVLPAIKSASTKDEFNDALDTMLQAAGSTAKASGILPDTLPARLKYNRNWGWTDDAMLRSDVSATLDTIKVNFRPHAECWVNDTTTITSGSYGGWLVFPHDTTLLNTNTYTSYPDESHRLLLMFKHWNIINYFDPYTYVFDKPMDTILYNHVLSMVSAANPNDLYEAIRAITSSFDDAHVEGLTGSAYIPFHGYYSPRLMLRYIENKYVVVLSGEPSISIGDAIVSVDGLTTSQWEDSLKGYVSAGNSAVFRRFMYNYLLGGNYGTTTNITYSDSMGTKHNVTLTRTEYQYGSYFPEWYYPADSLNDIEWTTMPCGTGYMNIGNLTIAGADSAYTALQNDPAIIFDIRNYPITNSAFYLAYLMYPAPTQFAKFTQPDVTYPGTFFWYYDTLGALYNPTPYNGKVILLFNEETQSSAEFSCMILGALPNVVKVGSQTAGTDGNITYFLMSQDIQTGFTTLGTFYPNGDSTERIGIVPDSVVTPTIKGIKQRRDEVLEKALAIACAAASVPTIPNNYPSYKVYPNPAHDMVNITATNIAANKLTIDITDITGRVLMEKEVTPINQNISAHFDVKALAAGMYLVNMKGDTQQYSTKIIIQ